jgi:hypothetical protein
MMVVGKLPFVKEAAKTDPLYRLIVEGRKAEFWYV